MLIILYESLPGTPTVYFQYIWHHVYCCTHPVVHLVQSGTWCTHGICLRPLHWQALALNPWLANCESIWRLFCRKKKWGRYCYSMLWINNEHFGLININIKTTTQDYTIEISRHDCEFVKQCTLIFTKTNVVHNSAPLSIGDSRNWSPNLI